MSITPLFSTPVYVSDTPYKINEKLIQKLKILNKDKNVSNSTSSSYNVLSDFPDLNSFCEDNIKKFKEILFIKNEIYITTSWFNYTEKNESHHLHNHPNSIFSGVLYLSGDIKINFHRGQHPFCLHLDYNDYNLANSEQWQMDLKPGDLILFPSGLQHEVKNYNNNDTRISLAFNTFVKGEICKDIQTSRLEI
tara:strand:- start:584 stop:1162 length:579 start_codon:yes stop_codon:yes gene_type:complete